MTKMKLFGAAFIAPAVAASAMKAAPKSFVFVMNVSCAWYRAATADIRGGVTQSHANLNGAFTH
jgi:hypothetical protein